MSTTNTAKKYPFINPVVEVYRGKEIRLYNSIKIRLSASEMKKFIDAKIDYEMSAREAIQSKGILCPCASVQIISYNKNAV